MDDLLECDHVFVLELPFAGHVGVFIPARVAEAE
ncbi:hypothetical protein RTM1035_02085 [Roseovarius sp. TM1035]|jgi:hypothetical protein|nr:hypothetical protein RTM1035_02085 [Roseovarius sp. TM1035]